MNTLRAGQIVLEPQVAGHAPEMFAVLSDPAIYEFENSPPVSATWLEQRFARLESRRSADGSELWLNWVIRLPSGVLAGYVQATVMQGDVAYVAYELASRFWRQGIGSAAVNAVLAELATNYAVRTFVAVLKARNFRSEALLVRLGFSPVPPPDVGPVTRESDEVVLYRLHVPEAMRPNRRPGVTTQSRNPLAMVATRTLSQHPQKGEHTMSKGTVRLHRVLRATPERVYRAFLDPDAMAKWLPPNGFTGRVHHSDARVGGTYRMSFTNFSTGQSHAFGGEYLELNPYELLRYTDRFDDASLPGEMKTTVALTKVSCGTELTVVQEGIPEVIPVEACYLGWQESLTLLAKLVEAEIPG